MLFQIRRSAKRMIYSPLSFLDVDVNLIARQGFLGGLVSVRTFSDRYEK